jgi:N-acetyl sugar amidotransferase
MRYCKRCVQPDTRPGISLNKKGVCSACIGHEEKIKKIDWRARRRELELILNKFRSRDGSYYDCIIPVSGGKDSTYQVYMIKKVFRMHPLAVTYRYFDRTKLGQKNLENLKRIGVDHIEVAANPETERRLIKRALIKAGDPCLIDHLGIFAVPLRLAVNYKIPLIIWGENPQLEYGGKHKERNRPYLDRKWLSRHGCLQGTGAEDWVSNDLSLRDLYVYTIPSDRELASIRLHSIFLGYYLPWDPVENYKIAKRIGFQGSPDGPRLGIYDFADLDSTNIVVHHYIKWFKFGITRMHDNISTEIRNGRMTREEGIRLLRSRKERVPNFEIKKLCSFLDMKESEFWRIIEKFRNRKIWKKDKKGKWYIPNYLENMDNES